MTITIGDLNKQEILTHTPEGEEIKTIGSSFFRGEHCNFNPYQKDFNRKDFLKRFLLKGWIPEAPFIDKNTKITAFGSCFAQNITKHLGEVGYSLSKDRHPKIYISSIEEGLVNVHSLLQQFEWALEDITPPTNLWHGFKCEEFGYDKAIQAETRKAMLDTDFFIITLGLSEIWYDEITCGIFWRAVPQAHYDPTRHKFRVCSFAETKQAIERIYTLISKHIPHAKLLFTLSPVPLAATFRPVSCITANTASKAILRAALDEFMRDQAGQVNQTLFYFPSYEIITELFFSKYGEDGRHPHPEIIKLIMHSFEAVYCKSNISLENVGQLYRQLRQENAAKILADTAINLI
jgi:hypothetical protein